MLLSAIRKHTPQVPPSQVSNPRSLKLQPEKLWAKVVSCRWLEIRGAQA